MTPQTSLTNVKHQAEQTVRNAAPWIENFARFGYAAKGVVYSLIGLLAAQAAFTTGGKTTDSDGAIVTIVQQPFGRALLAIVLIGLVGYVVWKLVQAFMDPENEGMAKRVGSFASAVGYGGLALGAGRLVMGDGTTGGQSTQSTTAQIMAQPFGLWIIGIAGLTFLGIGIGEAIRGWKGDFHKKLKLAEMSETERTVTNYAGRTGLIARGIVFGIIGVFLFEAARRADPKQAKGIGEALRVLEQQAYGPWLMGIVALGLVAYGIFMFVQARYRRIAVQ